MNVATLLENFEVLAESPEGIDRLRELILGMAVSGSILKSDTSSWRATTLGEEVRIIRGITFPSSAKGRCPGKGLLPCLRTANIQNEVDWEDLLYVSDEFVRNDDQYVQSNDLLISMANSRELVGKVALVRRNDIHCTLGGFIAAIRCGTEIDPKYLMTILRVPSAREKLIDSSTQTTNIANISLGRLRPFELKLPLMSEQRDIVAKVDELMALCDELEQQQKLRDNLRIATRKSAIDAISTATTPEELETAWNRINSNWAVIADSLQSVDALRTLVIDFGIQGQLLGANKIGSNGFPMSWTSRKFKDYCDIEGGNQPPKSVFASEPKKDYIRLFQIRDLGSNPVPVFIPKGTAKSLSTHGEILVGRYGASVGKVFKAQDGAYNVALVKFIFPKDDLVADFVYWMLKSSRSQAVFSGMSRSAQAGFNKRDLAVLDIPVPSIDEQKLITAKIDELMALCDHLEAELKVRSELAEKFALAVVSAA